MSVDNWVEEVVEDEEQSGMKPNKMKTTRDEIQLIFKLRSRMIEDRKP